MALVNFKKGTLEDYTQNQAQYAEYIYACTDTRDVFVFGIKQQGISDEIFNKLAAFDNSVIEVINSQKNVANGIAGLDANGKIDPSLVDGVVGHVLGLEQFVAENPTAGADQVGKYYYNSTSKKIIEGIGNGSDVAYGWEETDPQAQVLYNRRGEDENGHTNTLYRWDGSEMTAVSDPIAIGTVTGTAYDGGQGQANRDALNAMMNTVVTGFGLVTPDATQVTIAFTDADKNSGNNQYADGDGGNIIIPAATGTAAGMMSAADKAALDALTGDGEGSLADVAADLAALDAAAVKKIQVGTNAEQTPTEGLVTIANATTSADGAMAKEDKAKVDKIVDTGDGSQFLANDGTYKTVSMELSADYAPSTEVNEALEPEAGDSYEVAVGKLHKAILDNESVVAQAFVNMQTAIGLENPNSTLPDLSSTNYLGEAASIVAALQALDTALKTVADQAATISDLTSRVAALEAALTLKNV